MNVQKSLIDFIAIIRANIKLLYARSITLGHVKYHLLTRLKPRVNIIADSNSRIHLGKGILINSDCYISSTSGGLLVLGDMVGINRNNMIICHDNIYVGNNTIIGPNVCIYDHDHFFNVQEGVTRNKYKTAPIKIGSNCWIGAGSIILRGSTIGDNCLIAAGSIIKGHFPSGTTIIQKRETLVR